jgi:formylglycine-generating enzyme
MSASSTHWKAILQDGTLVAPGEANTLKYDYVASKWQLATALTDQADSNRSCAFKDMQNGGLTVPQLLKELAVFPADGSGYKTEPFYLNNGAGLERFPNRGGYWNYTSSAGVFNSRLSNPRAGTGASLGFRSAFYGA